jgi:hypothetical protein
MMRSLAMAGPVRGRVVAGLVMLCVIVGLTWPMITTDSAMTQDWPNHLWYMWRQSLTIRSDGLPSIFLNSGNAVFYPFYGFYGGSLYSLGGILSIMLGNAPVKAYVLTWMLGSAAAYGGLYWLARIAGVGRWLSHAPALVYVTSPYIITLIYARGAWPEFLATSFIPLFIAASVQVLRTRHLTLGTSGALAVSTLVLTGSHNITLLWGTTFIVLIFAFAVILIPSARSLLASRNILQWCLVAVPSALLNAWFLIPAIAYGSRTRIGSADWSLALRVTSVLTGVGRLFTLSRRTSVTASPGIAYAPDFSLALPVLAIAMVLIGGVLALARGRRADTTDLRRLLCICVGVGLVFGLLLTNWRLITDLPGPYHLIQFPYRLETYVLLATSGGMICVLAVTRSGAAAWSVWRALLVGVLAFSAIGAIEQVADYSSLYPPRNFVFDARHQPPASVYDAGDYSDSTLPVMSAVGAAEAVFTQNVHNDRVHATFAVSLTQTLVQSNVRAAPYLAQVVGATVVGRSETGFMVLRLPLGHPRLVTLTVERAASTPVELGRALSLTGALAFVLLLCAVAFKRVRRRRRIAQAVATSDAVAERGL